MNNRKHITAVALSAAIVGGGVAGATLGVPGISGAQNDQSTTTEKGDKSSDAQRGEFRKGGAAIEAAVDALGISTDDLRSALQEDKTIADIAKEKGVDKQKVIDAMVAAEEKQLEEMKSEIPDRMAKLVDGEMPMGRGGPGGHVGPRGHGGPGFPGGMDRDGDKDGQNTEKSDKSESNGSDSSSEKSSTTSA